MSYSWDEYAVAYETSDPIGDGWRAVVRHDTPDGLALRSFETARAEYLRMKDHEHVYPELYRNVRLLKRTTTVSAWQGVAA